MAGVWNGPTFIGDDSNDTGIGTDVDERLFGGLGNDALDGRGGNDQVFGGVGSDDLQGGDGNDRLVDVEYLPEGFSGLIGRDRLRGGNGDDVIVFNSLDTGDRAFGGAGTDVLEVRLGRFGALGLPQGTPITFTLGPNGASSIVQINAIDTLVVSDIEKMSFSGSDGIDIITGAQGDDTIWGNDGDDRLFGGRGNDRIDGGTGVHYLDGGDGTDTVSFDARGVLTGLTIRNTAVVDLGTSGTARNFEAFGSIATGNGSDRFLITQTTAIDIYSGGGNDTITVGDGGAAIDASAGDDVITTGAGSDAIRGGAGANLVRMGGGNDRYTHDTRLDLGNESVSGEGGNDTILTASGNDHADGGDGDDLVYTGFGNDRNEGGEGNDSLYGESGADTVYGGAGNDRLEGDTDVNTAALFGNDQLFGGDGHDTVVGGAGADLIYGGTGNDRLELRVMHAPSGTDIVDLGRDTIYGGTGNDTLAVTGVGSGRAERLDIVLNSAGETLVRVDGVTRATATGIEAVSLNSYGINGNRLEGGALADQATTGAGNDLILLFGGNDTANTGAGSDTIDAGSGDDLISFVYLGGTDRIFGGTGNDSITVGGLYLSQTNEAGLGVLDGGAGTDALTIYGSDRGVTFDGAAIFVGGVKVADVTGFESVFFQGQGTGDTVYGTDGNDTLSGNGGNDQIRGLDGDDRLDGGTENDTLYGGDGTDTLFGGTGTNQLYGGNGNDIITTSTGANETYGGTGNDTLSYAGDGLLDNIFGGSGTDLLNLTSAGAGPLIMSGSLASGIELRSGGVLQARAEGIEVLRGIGTSGSDSLFGGNDNDEFIVFQGTDTISAGAGDDRVVISADAGGIDFINMDDGTDLIVIDQGLAGDMAVTLSATMQVRVGGVVTGTVRDAERLEVRAAAGNDTLTGGDLNDSLSGGGGANRLSGLGGDDWFGVQLDAARDTVSGGFGDDTLQIFQPLSAIAMTTTTTGSVTVRNAGVVVLSATSIQKLFVYGSTAGNDTLAGLAGADTLFGFGGADSIVGGGGADQIRGGEGADTLTGGTGADDFVFQTRTEGGDLITDFTASDSIDIVAFGLTGGLLPGQTANLVANTNPVVPPDATTMVFLFETDTGRLSFDSDGAGIAPSVLLATLRDGASAATLTLAQIDII